MKKVQTIKFAFLHSLLIGDILSVKRLSQEAKKDIIGSSNVENFGLLCKVNLGESEVALENLSIFGSPTNHYYPDVKPSDLKPAEEDFIYPKYRMLSNTIVRKNYDPIEFPEELLKKSMGLMLGQTVNTNHDTDVENAVGVVQSVEWQDSYKIGDKVIPAGFNAVLKIDGKSNPRLARGIMMDPPAIHSNSVSVTFGWEKSHPEMSDEDFRNKRGSYDEKGQLIRKIANVIYSYNETSLVSHGADPFAQKIGADNKIVNPSYATVNNAAGDKPKYAYSVLDFKNCDTERFEAVSEDTTLDFTNNTTDKNQNAKIMLEYLKSQAIQLGITVADDATEESLQALINTKLTALLTDSENLVTKTTEVENLTNTLKGQEEKSNLIAVAEAYIADLRTEVETTYKLSLGKEGTTDNTILEAIKSADVVVLKGQLKQYADLVNTKFPLTCKCGSTEVSRASASAKEEGTPPKTIKTPTELAQAMIDKANQSKVNIHGE